MVYGEKVEPDDRFISEVVIEDGGYVLSDHFGRISTTQCRECEKELVQHDEVYNRRDFYNLVKQFSFRTHYCKSCVLKFAAKADKDAERFAKECEYYQSAPSKQKKGEFGEVVDYYDTVENKRHEVCWSV